MLYGYSCNYGNYVWGVFNYSCPISEAIIKVHSSSRAIEQETKIIHLHGDYNLLDEIIDNLNAMDLPLF